jgi:phage terminase large subunit-like protein
MGMRGINATPKRALKAANSPHSPRHPWAAKGLSRAERVIAFIETLACTAGPFAGTKLKLRPWQKKFIRAVYKTDKAGNRLVRTAVLSVGRKNGKTQLAAALCLCAMSGPEAEPRGECYAVACTRFQAGRVFNEMVAIITATPWLNDRTNIVRFRKELEDQVNGSTFDVLSADVAPVHGLSPSFACYDELAQVPSRALYDALSTALGGRSQPLMLVISTQAARRLVEEGKLRHGNHPVLTMCAANAAVEMDSAGNRKISKRRSNGRVDALVATCMALGIAARPAPIIDVRALIG